MADANQGMPEIQGTLPLYKRPEPLNVQMHRGKGLKYGDRPFDFLNETHFVPITIGELATASAHYPVVFLGPNYLPVAVMGLRPGENLFVDPATGTFEQYRYLPAFVRRYPFVAASHPDDADRFTVCVDAASHLMSDNPDQPFFNDAGEPTPFMQNAIDFVRGFETDVTATNIMIKRFRELDLFEEQTTRFQPRNAQGEPEGEAIVIATYWGISNDKVRALSGDVLMELRDNAFLSVIYAHMFSQSHWELILNRASLRRQGANPAPASGTMAPPPPEA